MEKDVECRASVLMEPTATVSPGPVSVPRATQEMTVPKPAHLDYLGLTALPFATATTRRPAHQSMAPVFVKKVGRVWTVQSCAPAGPGVWAVTRLVCVPMVRLVTQSMALVPVPQDGEGSAASSHAPMAHMGWSVASVVTVTTLMDATL